MIDIYLDGANLDAMREGRKNPLVKGFTTNPSLARSAGVTNYESFCKQALEIADGLPISFEVLSDEWDDIERQARKIASWGDNIYVKIPVSNTKGESVAPLMQRLGDAGIMCNVTAIFTEKQARDIVIAALTHNREIILSIFMGRINDAGQVFSGVSLPSGMRSLWASCRQVYSIYEAMNTGWDIITVTPDLLKKYEQLKGKDLDEYSLDTVKMFYNDAQKAGYTL